MACGKYFLKRLVMFFDFPDFVVMDIHIDVPNLMVTTTTTSIHFMICFNHLNLFYVLLTHPLILMTAFFHMRNSLFQPVLWFPQHICLGKLSLTVWAWFLLIFTTLGMFFTFISMGLFNFNDFHDLVLRMMRALRDDFFFVGVPLEEFLQVWMSFWDCVKQVLLTFMVAWLYLNYLFFMLITYMFHLFRLPMLLFFWTK